MFATVFVVCNLLTNECQVIAHETPLNTYTACEAIAEYTIEQVKGDLPPFASVDHKCVEFPQPA